MTLPRPKVVITDWTFSDLTLEENLFRESGIDLVGRQCKTESELIALVADADAVITQFARLNVNVIAAMTRARAIVRFGIGVDNVDLAAARERNIPVCNIPDYCINEVADHTLAFILATTRQVASNARHLREAKWGLGAPLTSMHALADLTVGVIGFGRIGREVVRRLLAFRCRVLLFDPVVPAKEISNAGAEAVSLDVLLAQSDVITPHCPSTAQTRRMFNATAFNQMKPGAIFINVGRGDLVESDALLAALQSGRLQGAALDVFDPEPIPADHPIRQLPNVILAAHIASASLPAVKRLRESAAGIAMSAARQQPVPNVVNGVKTEA